VSFIILIQLHIIAVLLGVLALCFVVIYPLTKRFTYWPQVVLGLTFNFGALMGWAAIDGHVSLAALCLYISGLFWTLAYDTIYAYQDKEDDAFIGVKSTALLFGDAGMRWVHIFYGLSMLVFVLAGIMGQAPALFYLITLLAYSYIFVTLKSWIMSDPDNCLDIFKKNMNLGFLLALACLLS
jgi:4-hydroxybenzoate polyprenyltransferase